MLNPEKAVCRFESVALEQCVAFHKFRQHERAISRPA
jgi:hypothetical protein